jgi:hypothetical protein
LSSLVLRWNLGDLPTVWNSQQTVEIF